MTTLGIVQSNINELCSREIYAGVLYFKKRNPHDSDEEIANSVCRYVGMKRVKGNEIW